MMDHPNRYQDRQHNFNPNFYTEKTFQLKINAHEKVHREYKFHICRRTNFHFGGQSLNFQLCDLHSDGMYVYIYIHIIHVFVGNIGICESFSFRLTLF